MPEWWNGIHNGLKIRRFGLRVRISPRVPPTPVAQLVEQRTFNPKVAGSSPAGSTKFTSACSSTAEQRTHNPLVAGSNPAGRTIFE